MQQIWRDRYQPIMLFLSRIWSIVWDALIEFIWADLRDGLIDLRELARSVRAVIWLGFAFVAICLILLTQTPTLRALFPLYTSAISDSGRGLLIPLPLFPFSLFLLTLAWAYLLVGAIRCHWLIRAGVLLLYTITVFSWLAPLLAREQQLVAAAGLLYLIVLISYFLPIARRIPPALYFAFILICVGAIFVLVQYPLILEDQSSGLPLGRTILENNVRSFVTLAIPLLLLIGLDIADFTHHASTWVSEALSRIFPSATLYILTFALLAWLVWQGVEYIATQQATSGLPGLFPLTGAFCLLLLLWLTWASMARIFSPSSPITLDHFYGAASKVAAALVLAFLLPLLASSIFYEAAKVLTTLSLALQTGFFGSYPNFIRWASNLDASATFFSTTIYDAQALWQRLCAIGAVAVALILYRRHFASAHYAITVGVTYLWVEVTRPGHWLQTYGWTSPEPLAFAWVAQLVGWVLLNLWRHRLSYVSLQRLLLICLILILLRQTNLIAAPLDPLFSLAGVATLAVGLGWDLLTAGSWANVDSKSLPRISRIFLYLGYLLLTVILINWAVAAHDFTLLGRFTGEAALTGLSLLGYPYLYALLYLLMTSPPSVPISAEPSTSP